ncbi:ACT domain-containing protein [bacterium 210820-DFI.6.52]|nr:ACT domain-containing protein [bacterium 210820-DFI.6.52]
MTIEVLDGDLSVCQVRDLSAVDWGQPLCFAEKTDEECSLVCPTGCAPKDALAREDGWRAFRIAGELDFSLVGILAQISSLLAGAGIALFALSTYRTDYILVKGERLRDALAVLAGAGWEVSGKKPPAGD